MLGPQVVPSAIARHHRWWETERIAAKADSTGGTPVALGLRNADVAERPSISEQTIKSHLSNVFEKLKIQDRVELTVYAIRNGIIGVHERP